MLQDLKTLSLPSDLYWYEGNKSSLSAAVVQWIEDCIGKVCWHTSSSESITREPETSNENTNTGDRGSQHLFMTTREIMFSAVCLILFSILMSKQTCRYMSTCVLQLSNTAKMNISSPPTHPPPPENDSYMESVCLRMNSNTETSSVLFV